MGDESDETHWTSNDILGLIAGLVIMDIFLIGIYTTCRMYRRHRYIISHFHDTVSSFFSYMGDYRYKIFVAVVLSMSQTLYIFAYLTWSIRRTQQGISLAQETLHHIIFTVCSACAVLSNLLIFPLKLGSQRFSICSLEISPGFSYRAHYIGGVALLLVNPLVNFGVYFLFALIRGWSKRRIVVMSLFGSALLAGALSLMTKHPCCTQTLCRGLCDPEDRTEKPIQPAKALRQIKGKGKKKRAVKNDHSARGTKPNTASVGLGRIQCELRAIRDAEDVIKQLKNAKKSSSSEEPKEDIKELGDIQSQNEEIPGLVPPLELEGKSLSPRMMSMWGGEMSVVTVGGSTLLDLQTSVGIGKFAHGAHNTRTKPDSNSSSFNALGDWIDFENLEEDAEHLNKEYERKLEDTFRQIGLTEAKRPCLRLWSTGCEIFAIGAICAANQIIATDDFAFL
mmetsp:Transcript_6032/g.9286  ORF Transcript_6032/g.9286 Transcript_6032/m.9286 type:complete len:451 (-) Transcript_6032:116-1468(-)